MNDPTLVVRVAANLAEMKANLSQGVSQIETYTSALKQASAAYDGSRVVSQASAAAAAIQNAGGVTALTSAEMARANALFTDAAAKLELMGKGGTYAAQTFRELADATKKPVESGFAEWVGKVNGLLGPLGIALSAIKAIQFVKAMFDDADALERMHDQTGIAVEGLQALRISGDDAGVSMESMTKAVGMLQKKLGTGDEGAASALGDLHINLKQFIALDGAHQMAALADAIKGINDPTRVAADLSKLFGRNWEEVLPALKRGFAELSDGTAVMSTQSVKALDDLGDATGRLWLATKANLGEAVADLLTGTTSAYRKWSSDVNGFVEQVVNTTKPDWGALAPPGLPKDLEAIELGFVKDAEAIKAHAEQVKAQTQAWIELDPFGMSTKETYDAIEPSLRGLIEDYLNAGASVETLAKAFPELSKAQIDAVKAEIDATKEWERQQAGALEEVTKLHDEYAALVVARSHDAVAAQIADVHKWADDLTATMQKKGQDTADFYDAVAAVVAEKLNQITQKTLESDNYTREHYQLLADQAKAAYEFALDNASSYTNQEIALLREKYRNAEMASNNWASTASDDMAKASDAADGAGKSIDGVAAALKRAAALAIEMGGTVVKTGDDVSYVFTSAGQALSAFDSGLDASKIKVKALDDSVESLADAVQRFNQGNAITYDLSSQQGLDFFRKENPAASISWDDQKIEKFTSGGGTLQQLVQMGVIDFYAGYKGGGSGVSGGFLPGFAEGTASAPGGLAIVGERGPEVVDLPHGSAVYPTGTAPASSVTVHVHVTQPLGTPSAIASAVSAAFDAKLRAIGTRLPTRGTA